MAWMEINDCAIRYEFRRGKGPVFVLMHEMGGTLESWDEVVSLFPETAQVLRYDQRGFGLSEKIIGDVSVEQHVQDLAELLNKLGVSEPVALSGVAVGAGISIAFAARYPEKVSHLVAFSPSCGIAAEKKEGAIAKAADIALKGMRAEGPAIFDLAFPESLQTDQQKYDDYRSAWFGNDGRSLGAIYKMLAAMELSEALARLSGTVVFVGGEFDALRPPAEIRRLGGLCPVAQQVIIPSGHFMQVHSPKYVANMLLRLVHDHEPAQAISETFLMEEENRVGAVRHAA